MSTKEGLEYARSLIYRYRHLPIYLWSAIPCTGGSTAQRRNKHHPNHAKNMAKHNRLFIKLHRNLMILSDIVLNEIVDGQFVFEWPFPNDWWQRKEMRKMKKKYNLKDADFDGCRLGSVAETGGPTKKPWRLSTTSQDMVEELNDLKCTSEWNIMNILKEETGLQSRRFTLMRWLKRPTQYLDVSL